MPKYKVGDKLKFDYNYIHHGGPDFFTIAKVFCKGEFVPEMGWVARCDGYLLERKPGVFEWDETNAVDNEKHGLIVELLASTQENISVNNKYPHKCTRCDYPAYVGAWDIDCSNPNCPTKS